MLAARENAVISHFTNTVFASSGKVLLREVTGMTFRSMKLPNHGRVSETHCRTSIRTHDFICSSKQCVAALCRLRCVTVLVFNTGVYWVFVFLETPFLIVV
jgi:hypothetical protein